MKIICLAALSLSILLTTSCLTSVHPLVTIHNIVEENSLIGTWQQGEETYKVEKLRESALYREIENSVQIKDNENAKKEPLRGKEKEDSIFQSRAYCVSFSKEGIDYYMSGSLTRIDGQLYMELYPIVIDDKTQPDGSGLDYTFDYLPGITIAKLDLRSDNTVQLHFPDGDYIKKQINEGNIRIKHEKDNWFDTFLITASSRDLRSFLQKYGHDQRLFSKENSVTLTRKG
jgi:hypothetical protein